MAGEATTAAAKLAGTPRSAGRVETIESKDNRWLKNFRAALKHGYLSNESLIGVEGPHLIEEAVRSGLEIEVLLISPEGAKALDAWPGEAPRSLRILKTTSRLFDSVAGTEHSRGVAALVRAREWTFDDLVRDATPLVVVLAGVQDPGNVGTAVRSAEAFGATGLVATKGTADPWSAKALRASAGSALRLPILRGMAPAVAMAQLRVAGLKIVAATSRATSVSEPQPNLTGSCAIFVGNEGAGLTPEVERSAEEIFTIPMTAGVESLNAGVAASIILYEAARQRGRFSAESGAARD